MKRLAASIALMLSLITAGSAFADYKGPAMTAELKKDLNARVEKTPAWRTTIGGKPGDKMRPFRATSIRSIQTGPSGGRIMGGFGVSGKFSTATGRTYIKSMIAPR